MKLGKKAARIDPRTIKLKSIFKALLPPLPSSFNVDRAFPNLKFPVGDAYGNLVHGCCVKVAEYMHQMRFEAFEQGVVLPVTEEIVLRDYFKETGGKENDYGLVMLDSLNYWHKKGLLFGRPKKFLGLLPYNGKHYKCHAFAGIDMIHIDEVKASIALLFGMATGLMLPATAEEQLAKGQVWDVVDKGKDSEPGSWGGHGVYTHSYEPINEKTDDYIFHCYTWGKWQPMTYRFLLKYCDERYAVVDNANRKGSPVDVEKLEGYLLDISKNGKTV